MIIVETVWCSVDNHKAAWLVDDSHYLIIQSCDDGWDYTLYTLDCREVDGGQLDMPELSIDEACIAILEDFRLAEKKRKRMLYDDVLECIDAAESCSISSYAQRTPLNTFCHATANSAISCEPKQNN